MGRQPEFRVRDLRAAGAGVKYPLLLTHSKHERPPPLPEAGVRTFKPTLLDQQALHVQLVPDRNVHQVEALRDGGLEF